MTVLHFHNAQSHIPEVYITPILTGWEGITEKYKPDDWSTSPAEGSACAKSEGLYFPVMPETTSQYKV